MKLAYFGSGYVGQVNAVIQAVKGHDVVMVDIDESVVESINSGKPTIYEDKLDGLLSEVVNSGRLRATLDYASAVKSSEVIFICVGTPSSPDGSIDVNAIKSASVNIGRALKLCDDLKVVVVKSTVLPWVLKEVKSIISSEAGHEFGFCMNPEFLREGLAVHDCLEPDSIVIGGDKKSVDVVSKVYSWSPVKPSVTGLYEASLIKYAKNSFLATKISFANVIANYCDEQGINAREVLRVMAEDKRISPLFLNNGPGFGGSCFPKDVKALLSDMKGNELLSAVMSVNKEQYKQMIKLANEVADLKGTVAVLGLSFKPGTDDVRESPSIKLVKELQRLGCTVRVFDPQAMDNALKELGGVTACNNVEECVAGAGLVFMPVAWPEFKSVRYYTNVPIIQGHLLLSGDNILTLGNR